MVCIPLAKKVPVRVPHSRNRTTTLSLTSSMALNRMSVPFDAENRFRTDVMRWTIKTMASKTCVMPSFPDTNIVNRVRTSVSMSSILLTIRKTGLIVGV